MSDFYPLRSSRIDRDVCLLKKLEMKQIQLEEQVLCSKKLEQNRKFRDHPSQIHQTGSDTTISTPRIKTNFSSSTTHIVYRKSKENDVQCTKQRAQEFHRLLHEKLSIIDSVPSESSDIISVIGNSYLVSNSGGDRCQSDRIKTNDGSDSSIGTISTDSDGEYSSLHSRQLKDSRKNTMADSRTDNNCSAASKATSGGLRESSSASRLSFQQRFGARGITASEFERKFKVVVTKSLQTINAIRNTLAKGILPPDGEEEESRRIVRAKEFSNRFSRNYLYPLGRQMKDLSVLSQINPLVINQKLLSIYQILQNALQAYQTHLPTSLGNSSYNQLKILMTNIVEVCGVHRSQLKDHEETYVVEFIDTLKINSELTIQKVEECLSVCPTKALETALTSEQSKISLTKYGDKNGGKQNIYRKGGPLKKEKSDKRLSMYTKTASFRKDAPWKRVVEGLAKKKFNVQSKYRTATYKHRPPIEKDPEIISIPKLKSLFPARPSAKSRIITPINEDFIKTMVEQDQNGERHMEKEEWENMEKKTGEQQEAASNKEEILIKLLQFTLKNHNQGPKEDDKTEISNIMKLLKKEPNDEFLKKVINGLTDKGNEANPENNQMLTLEIVKSQGTVSDGGSSAKEKNKRKEPKITVTGDKNARLICITDDNSLIEPSDDEELMCNDVVCQTDIKDPTKILTKTSSETQIINRETIQDKIPSKHGTGGKVMAQCWECWASDGNLSLVMALLTLATILPSLTMTSTFSVMGRQVLKVNLPLQRPATIK